MTCDTLILTLFAPRLPSSVLAEVDALIGDASKASELLGWEPKVDGMALARIMVRADIAALEHAGRPWVDTPDLDWWPARGGAR